jgi:alcohol dehydrogenase class IV
MSNPININIPHSIMGPGAVNGIGDIVREFAPAKILIVTDAGVAGAGLLTSITTALEKGGYKFDIFAGCQPEAPISIIEKLAGQIEENKYSMLIGVGGGSTMDTTKMAGIIAGSGLKVLDIRDGKPAKKVIPKVLVPTTAGTGSEWSNVAVVTNDSVNPGQTTVIITPQNVADAAIIDPELTVNLPKRITADTGMDALTHAIEAFTSPAANVMSDTFAESAIKLIAANLRPAYTEGSRNIEARYNMSAAASLAMQAVVLASIGLAHIMNEPLGKRARLSHGATCTLLLPAVIEYNLSTNPAKYAKVAGLMGENINGIPVADAAAKAAEAVRRLAGELGMPQKANAELTGADISIMVDELFTASGPLIKMFVARNVSREDVIGLYYKVLSG